MRRVLHLYPEGDKRGAAPSVAEAVKLSACAYRQSPTLRWRYWIRWANQ
ncbi:hypothetical protein KCP73_26600 [Salmonella enterica subsp. enterica]|nr:hypothetical protein KCP73_26600 [Salmonella enterica subsp. enterica]